MCEILYHCIVIYISLITNNFVGHLKFYLEKYLFKCTAHFLVDFLSFLLQSCKSYESWRSFLCSSFMSSWHLCLIPVSLRSIPFLSFIEPIFACNVPLMSLIFLKSLPFYCFPLFLCIDHCRRLSCLFLLFFGTLYSVGYTFPFLLCLSLLFFSQVF